MLPLKKFFDQWNIRIRYFEKNVLFELILDDYGVLRIDLWDSWMI